MERQAAERKGIRSWENSGLMERQAAGRKGSGVGGGHCSSQGRRRVRLEGPRAQTEKNQARPRNKEIPDAAFVCCIEDFFVMARNSKISLQII